MMDGPLVILILKIAVVAVTVLLLASLLALAKGNTTLHGRINVVFATLTLSAVVGLEVVVRIIDPDIFTYFPEETLEALRIHLGFSVPAALLLPIMLYTGLRRHYRIHLSLAMLFSLLWIGTVVTGLLLPAGK